MYVMARWVRPETKVVVVAVATVIWWCGRAGEEGREKKKDKEWHSWPLILWSTVGR
jgi:hypothetical protein